MCSFQYYILGNYILVIAYFLYLLYTKIDKKEIAKLQLEQLKDIIHDPAFQNILLLRKYIKEENETKYFNIYSEENERKEET